jgi:hypothetical protein
MVRSSVHPIIQSFVRSFVQIIFVQPLCCRNSDRSFDHSIVHRSFIVPIYRSSFVHSPYSSFVQIIFVLPLCRRNSDRSFVRSFIVPIHRSSFGHSHYSSMISIVTFCCQYSSLLFIVTIHRLSNHPQFQLLIHHAVQSTLDKPDPYSSHMNSGDCDFPSSRELPIWSPIPGFSKLSTLNFEIPSN